MNKLSITSASVIGLYTPSLFGFTKTSFKTFLKTAKIQFMVFLSLSVTQVVYADTSAERVQNKLNAIRSMTASFHQVVKAKQREVSQSSGKMALERPGRFRWQTKEPMEQLVVADGKSMWVYDVDLEQVTVKKQEKGVGGTAGLFLSGYNEDITKDFDVTQKNNGSRLVFNMNSKSSKANFQRIELTFEGDLLKGIVLYDQLGQVTSVRLSNIKSNPKISGSLFQFKPPKGVDVVRQ